MRRDILKHAFQILRILLGVGMLVLALWGIDVQATLQAVLAADPLGLGLVFGTILLTLGLKAWRWKFLLLPIIPDARPGRVLGLLLTGQSVNFLLPLRSGDLLRAALMSAGAESRIGGVTAGIAVEKAFDALALACITAMMLPFLPSGISPLAWQRGLLIAIALLVAIFLLVFKARVLWERIGPAISRFPPAFRDRILGFGNQLVEGLVSMRSGQGLFPALLLTLTIWFAMLLTNLALFKAMRLPVTAPAGLLVLILVYISQIPSLMPGNLGPFYLAVRIALQPFGYGSESQVVYALFLHTLIFVPPLLGGGIYFLARKGSRTS